MLWSTDRPCVQVNCLNCLPTKCAFEGSLVLRSGFWVTIRLSSLHCVLMRRSSYTNLLVRNLLDENFQIYVKLVDTSILCLFADPACITLWPVIYWIFYKPINLFCLLSFAGAACTIYELYVFLQVDSMQMLCIWMLMGVGLIIFTLPFIYYAYLLPAVNAEYDKWYFRRSFQKLFDWQEIVKSEDRLNCCTFL